MITPSLHHMTITPITAPHPPGWEQYACKEPGCGRVVWMSFDPFDRLVIIPGDDSASHEGGRWLTVSGGTVSQDDNADS